ncbi:MAG: beta-lactamase family protein, partial [Bifidobacteriaceae bacterium]|nr:beta-lactamase family protein [Bifidobacteriaceae bacterium]
MSGFAKGELAGIERFALALGQADPNYSGQIAVYRSGRLMVDLTIEAGAGAGSDWITGVFSVSKGVAAIVIARLAQSGDLDLDAPVTRYWPEFGACGKAGILVRQALSHQAGVIGVPGGFTNQELSASHLAAAKLAAAWPLWRPGAMFGYHGITIGVIMEELVRRITGATLQEVY